MGFSKSGARHSIRLQDSSCNQITETPCSSLDTLQLGSDNLSGVGSAGFAAAGLQKKSCFFTIPVINEYYKLMFTKK